MKTTYLLVSIACILLAGCIGEPTIDTDEGAVLVSEPDAGGEGNIVAPCPPDMPPSYCDPEGGEGGGTGGGTGGGGGGSGGGGGGSSGDPLPCLGSMNSWCATHRRCEMRISCSPDDAVPPVPFPDAQCHRDTDRSPCVCLY